MQSYNPINYLRNVAINNSRTAYTFYVDVDLVPGPHLYDSLCRRLEPMQHSRQRIALVVPAFEAFDDLPQVDHLSVSPVFRHFSGDAEAARTPFIEHISALKL